VHEEALSSQQSAISQKRESKNEFTSLAQLSTLVINSPSG
jgi:hypothetical protein